MFPKGVVVGASRKSQIFTVLYVWVQVGGDSSERGTKGTSHCFR
jgi:hypothetical protein